MIITPQGLKALFTNYRQEFQGALNAAPSDWNKVAMPVPSTTRSNTYGWLGQFPRFREWIGDRVINDMKAQSYAIENKTFESTVGISRDDMEDDNLGIYSPMVQEMGRAAATFPDEELVFPLFPMGFSTACYDGQNFFDTEHPVYAKADGTGTATSVSNYTAGPTDSNGDPTNPRWYLLDMSRAIKPFIYQRREAPNFQQMTAMNDEAVFTSNQFRMGARARGNGGFGLWQLAHASDLELTADNFRQVYDEMREVKADGGRPLGIRPTLLVCPPSLEKQAEQILKTATLSGGGGNVNYNKADVLATPWLG
ncbi:Mu-like prophage major head subunit gpT family protein [Salinisphaera hydrothermalis]|uniref:Mu-like prophage major head subunit gpT family protein n=1 Tax=Salinisphaera hydrothermalis TaxID=563188 RepID=UPI003340D2C6